MKKNDDANQVVIDSKLYDSLMLIASEAGKSFNKINSDEGFISDVGKQLVKIRNHVCKFNTARHEIRKVERSQVAKKREQRRKELMDFVKANCGKEMWQLQPSMTRNGACVYYKVTPMRRSQNNKDLLTIRYAYGFKALASHHSLFTELPEGYQYHDTGNWAGMAMLHPGDLNHATES